MSEIITVTEEGYKKLVEELDYLKTTKKAEIKEAIKTAREFGDLSENSEYEAARTEQAQVESRILELDEMMKHVRVVSEEDFSHDRVSVGSKITVHNIDANTTAEYKLVGATEANPFEHRISDASPIGKAIIGAKAGDIVTVKTPRGETKIKIEKIEKEQ